MLILLVGALLLGFAIYLAAESATSPAREQRLTVRRASRYGLARMQGNAPPRLRFRERVVAPAVQRLAAITLRLSP